MLSTIPRPTPDSNPHAPLRASRRARRPAAAGRLGRRGPRPAEGSSSPLEIVVDVAGRLAAVEDRARTTSEAPVFASPAAKTPFSLSRFSFRDQ